MSFDMQELNRRSYQVLSTLYHLSRFFMENATFDKFNPQKYSFDWAIEIRQAPSCRHLDALGIAESPLRITQLNWATCEFNAALACA